jgi:hypothetical protein
MVARRSAVTAIAIRNTTFETFVSTRLGDVPGVDKLDSHITMKLIK